MDNSLVYKQQGMEESRQGVILASIIQLNLDWVNTSLVWNATEYGGVKVGSITWLKKYCIALCHSVSFYGRISGYPL